MLEGEFRGIAFEILRMAQRKDFIRGFFIKMEEKNTINEIKIEPIPFFKKDTLAYSKSGHELEESDRHYRCKEHCKTESGEKQIRKERLQSNFNYYVQKLRLEPEKAEKVSNDLMRKYLISLLMESDDGIIGKQEVLDTTIRVMDEDLKNIKSVKAEDEYYETGQFKGGGRLKKEDIETFEDTFVTKQKEILPQQLFAVLLSYLKTLSDPRYARHLGRGLALISKKIYISNEGKIEKIEFERWGWYVLNYIDKRFPDYLNSLKQKGVVITNGYDKIIEMDINEAVHSFKGSNFLEATNWLDVDSLSTLFEILRNVIKSMTGGPEDIQKATLQMLDFMNTNPLAQFASQMLPAVGKIKLKKK